MRQIIGLVGLKGSGKSTVAGFLKDLGFREIAIADHLKETCSKVFKVPLKDFTDPKKKELRFYSPRVICAKDIKDVLSAFKISLSVNEAAIMHKNLIGVQLNSPRHIAQVIGTDLLRLYCENIHCDMLDLKGTQSLVISDVRFENELNYFKKLKNTKYHTIYIEREIINTDFHESEKGIPKLKEKCDFVLNNTSTIDDLSENVQLILKDLEDYII